MRLEGWDSDEFDEWDDVGWAAKGIQPGMADWLVVGGGSDCGLSELGIEEDFEEDLDMLIAVWL